MTRMTTSTADRSAEAVTSAEETTDPEPYVLSARDVRVVFGRGNKPRVQAVNGVSLDIGPGECVGLVGESGSGKSTFARALIGLVQAAAGTIRFRGKDLTLGGRGVPGMSMIFQDPYSSLDPSMPISESVSEPLWGKKGLNRADRLERVHELLELVGSPPEHATRYPHEFSGGQRQRLAIARALASDPDLLLCDEAVSALDVSTQNQIVNLLVRLKRDFGVSLLFIAHDLSLVRAVSSRVAVMYLGRIVEVGPVDRIFERPAHPYSEALLSAVPTPDPEGRETRQRIILRGDPPDPAQPPTGCPFHTRCRYRMAICAETMPTEKPVAGGGTVACHLHEGDSAGPLQAAWVTQPDV